MFVGRTILCGVGRCGEKRNPGREWLEICTARLEELGLRVTASSRVQGRRTQSTSCRPRCRMAAPGHRNLPQLCVRHSRRPAHASFSCFLLLSLLLMLVSTCCEAPDSSVFDGLLTSAARLFLMLPRMLVMHIQQDGGVSPEEEFRLGDRILQLFGLATPMTDFAPRLLAASQTIYQVNLVMGR